MNIQCILTGELLLYKFKLGYNAAQATKNICCVEGESAVNHSTVTRWLKKFHFGCMKLFNQTQGQVGLKV